MFAGGLQDLVSFNPSFVWETDQLERVLELVQGTGIHHWPVLNSERRLVGILSDQDVVRVLVARCAAHEAVREGVLGAENTADQPLPQVREVMSYRTFTIDMENPPEVALQKMVQHGVHSLPVVEDSCLLGMVTSSDFLRVFSYGQSTLARTPISRFLVRSDEFIDSTDSLDDAKLQIELQGCDHLPVMASGIPVGVLSRRDLRRAKCRLIAREYVDGVAVDHNPVVANHFHSSPTTRPGERLGRVAAWMVEHRVRAVAVTNQANRLLGTISEDSILQAIAAEAASAPKKQRSRSISGPRAQFTRA